MTTTAGTYRNTSSVPLDGFAEGRQVFPQQDVVLTISDLELPQVMVHLEQRTLVPVTLSPTASPPAATPDSSVTSTNVTQK